MGQIWDFWGHFEPNMGQNMGNMGNIRNMGNICSVGQPVTTISIFVVASVAIFSIIFNSLNS